MRTTLPPVRFEHGSRSDDVVVMLPSYSETAVMVIKKLPPGTRRWDNAAKVWRVHPAYAGSLAATLHRLGFPILSNAADTGLVS